MQITYKELLTRLQEFSEEELEQTATIYLMQQDEYVAINGAASADDGVLDDGHKILVVNF